MSSHSASQLFDVFVEAKSALEELPKVKADLAESQALAQSYADDLTNRDSLVNDLQAQLAFVKSDLADKEAVLARVTFQHETLRSAIGAINDTVRSVSDRPVSEPVAEPVPQPVSFELGQSVTDPTASATSTTESHSATTANAGSDSANGSSTSNAEPDRPLAQPNASDGDNSPDKSIASVDDGSKDGTPSPTPSQVKEDREPVGESTHTTSGETDMKPSEAHSTGSTSAPTPTMNDKPYLGWGSHRKPHAVTWGDFERLGGYRPHWCNPDLT